MAYISPRKQSSVVNMVIQVLSAGHSYFQCYRRVYRTSTLHVLLLSKAIRVLSDSISLSDCNVAEVNKSLNL